MPYSNPSDLPKQVSSLPLSGKKLFIRAFNKVLEKSGDEKQAFQIAWSVVKKNYIKSGNKWVQKTSITTKTAIGKSGFFSPSYYFDAIISSNKKDSKGETVSSDLLEQLALKDKIDAFGDIDHKNYDGDSSFFGLFKKVSHVFKDGKLFVRFVINKKHSKYNDFITKKEYEKYKDLSAEFYDVRTQDSKIIYASRIGWSLVDDGANPDAKIIGKKPMR